jgi:uncharacterized protein with FMN-binding domain
MLPKRAVAALAITTVALVLLLSFKTPDDTVVGRTTGTVAVAGPATGAGTGTTATPTPKSGTTGSPSGATPAPTKASGNGSGSATTVDGQVVSTRYGDVQVEVVVAGGKIQDVVALQLPTGRRSGQISSYVAPILHEEVLQAQSAKIDLVSGATYTSDAYAQSLQSALDQAGLG